MLKSTEFTSAMFNASQKTKCLLVRHKNTPKERKQESVSVNCHETLIIGQSALKPLVDSCTIFLGLCHG